MFDHCLVAEFSNSASLGTAIEVLEKNDFSKQNVSVVTRADQVEDTLIQHATDVKSASPPAEKTTAASTLAGGAVGTFLGTATMIGPMLVLGPVLGMVAGAAGGSLLSTVENFGVDHQVGKQYESKVASGASLVVVVGDELMTAQAERLLQTCGPDSMKRYNA